MRSNESPNRGETFARVLTHDERAISLKNAVRIFWIDNQVREIERAPYHPITSVPFVPGQSAIVGDEERALGRFDESVNPFRVRRRDSDRKPAIRFFRKALVIFRHDLCPCFPAVTRTKQAAGGRFVGTAATRTVFPSFAAKIPHSGKHHIWIVGIECD